MTEVYFIRHSLRDNAAYDDMDVPLTAEGEKRALILADAFANVSIELNFFQSISTFCSYPESSCSL